jgi:hypothetical protein
LTNCTSTSSAWNSSELQLLNLINGLRSQSGLSALHQSPTLSNMAAWMAEDMAAHGGGVSNPPTHDDWSKRTYYQRSQDCGDGGYNGENVGWGFPSAQAMFNGWSASPGHLAAMLNTNFKAIGIAQVGNTWVADFSSIDDSGSTGGGGGNPTATRPSATSTGSATTVPTAPLATSTPAPSSTAAPKPFLPLRRAFLPLISTE